MTWPGLPVLVKLRTPVILIGTGEAAAAKRRLLERAGADIVGDHPDARLAIVAMDDEAEARATAKALRARGLLVNVVDRPELCDFTLPAVVDRAPVLVAVMTGGVSAGLAAAVRQRLERVLPASLGQLAEALGAARETLRMRFPDARERRQAIGAALAGPLDPLVDHGQQIDALVAAIGAAKAGSGTAMMLSSADPEDLTLRHARALALAERVHHAPGVPPAILARARADAPRLASPTRPAQLGTGEVWVEMA